MARGTQMQPTALPQARRPIVASPSVQHLEVTPLIFSRTQRFYSKRFGPQLYSWI